MLYQYHCQNCGKEFEEFRMYEERNNVFHCGARALKMIGQVNTHKDLQYSFTTEMFGKPVQIASKGHYKRLLKQHGLADASIQECRKQAEKCKRWNEDKVKRNVKTRVDRALKRMQQDNVIHDAQTAISKVIKGGKEVANGKR